MALAVIAAPAPVFAADDGSTETSVKVYKPNGSIQCRSSGIPLQDMEKELTDKGINVLSSCPGFDGFMRTTVCGAAAGGSQCL